MRNIPQFFTAFFATSLTLPLLAPSAIASQEIMGVQDLAISSSESSLSLSWEPVAGAVEYVVFEELPKPEHDRGPLSPIYRGGTPGFDYDGLGPHELSRLRILALDESEVVLARTLVRTSTRGTDGPSLAASWIASGEGVEIFLGSQEDAAPVREYSESSTLESGGLGDSFVDSNFTGAPATYQLVSEGDVQPQLRRDSDFEFEEEITQNHLVEVPEFSLPEGGDLSGEIEAVEGAQITHVMARSITWEAFIPDEYIPVPLFCATPGIGDGDEYFGGDNRGFGITPSYRFRMTARANFNVPQFQGTTFTGWGDPGYFSAAYVGPTILYTQQADGTMVEEVSETAPEDEIEVSSDFVNRTSAHFTMVADSTNPLCSVFNVFDAPAINVLFDAQMHVDGSYSYLGFRDMAPSHSAIISTHTIQTFPSPTFAQFVQGMAQPHRSCVHKHNNSGFQYLAFPPASINFNSSQHSDPSLNGDCSTMDP